MTLASAGVALIFTVSNINSPDVTQGPTVSDKLFESHKACEQFVNAVADDGTGIDVVDDNHEFEFASKDGMIFRGGCYTAEQFRNKILKESV